MKLMIPHKLSYLNQRTIQQICSGAENLLCDIYLWCSVFFEVLRKMVKPYIKTLYYEHSNTVLKLKKKHNLLNYLTNGSNIDRTGIEDPKV